MTISHGGMEFDLPRAMELLSADVMRIFKEGLQLMLDKVAAHVAEQDKRLENRALQLAAEREELANRTQAFEAERAVFEEGRARWDPARQELPAVVRLNMQGKGEVEVLRAVLQQCKGSLLHSCFGGTWDMPRDGQGRLYLEFPPDIFVPLVEYLQKRYVEEPQVGPNYATPPPRMGEPGLERKFQEMLQYYGIRDWVYQAESLEHTVQIEDQVYTAWPSCPPDEATTDYSMAGEACTLPRGWEVVPVWDPGFDKVMMRMLKHPWGTSRLCARGKKGHLWSFRTKLAYGTPGTRDDLDTIRVSEVQDGAGRAFRFAEGQSGQSSSRLLIRSYAPSRADGPAVLAPPVPEPGSSAGPPRGPGAASRSRSVPASARGAAARHGQ